MKRILIYVFVAFFTSLACYGIGDAVATSETSQKGEYTETRTEYKRDGRTILVDYEVAGKDRHFWNQIIQLGEFKIARIITINEETSYIIEPNTPVTVAFNHSEEGELVTVGIEHEEVGAVEGFTVEDGRLVPMKGDDIVKYREGSADIQDLFKASGAISSEEFLERALGIIRETR